jgi:hypothetical protein
MTAKERQFIHNLELVERNRTELSVPVCINPMAVIVPYGAISVIFDGNVFRLSTTREPLGDTPKKAAATLREKDLHYVNTAFIECRGLTEFIINYDTTEDELNAFLRECYSDRKTAGAVLKNPEAVISIREHLGELDLSVRFDQRSGLKNKSHCSVHELYEYLQEVSK